MSSAWRVGVKGGDWSGDGVLGTGVITRRSVGHAGRKSEVLALAPVVERPATLDMTLCAVTKTAHTEVGLFQVRSSVDDAYSSQLPCFHLRNINAALPDTATWKYTMRLPLALYPTLHLNAHDCSPSDPIPVTDVSLDLRVVSCLMNCCCTTESQSKSLLDDDDVI